MYYVIKRQNETPLSAVIGFQVPRYTVAKNSENVIFHFEKDGKQIRKWIKKEDIVLLTDDKRFFMKILKKFKAVEETQKKLVEQAKEQLSKSVDQFTEVMDEEIKNFEEIRDSTDIPCVLKNL